MDNLLSPVLTVFLSVVAGIVTAWITSRIQVRTELAKQVQSRFNERKWDAYMDFAHGLQQLLFSVKASDEAGMTQAKQRLNMFGGKLWVVGSDRVVKAVGDCIQKAQGEGIELESPREIFNRLFKVIIEMRRDLGYTSSRLTSEDFVSALVVKK